jgi:hypothetical protein
MYTRDRYSICVVVAPLSIVDLVRDSARVVMSVSLGQP